MINYTEVYKRKDYYYERAKKEGFFSRAAYKLTEIVESYRVIGRDDRVIDVGCSPGGWSQVASRIVGEKGVVLGIDIERPGAINSSNFIFIQGDIRSPEVQKRAIESIGGRADVVISDASPKLTGIKERDHSMSVDLITEVFTFAKKVLKKGGNMLVKVIEGPELNRVFKEIKGSFEFTKIYRPDSTRSASRENYIIAKGFIA